MTPTNSDFITSALRLIGVLNEVQSASPEQGQHGLSTLNDLMAYLEQEGIDLQYNEQSNLTADLPVPAYARPAIKYRLAAAIAPEYGRKLSPELVATATEYYKSLIRQSVNDAMKETELLDIVGRRSTYDITRGF